MPLLQLQLGSVFDGDDSLCCGHMCREPVQERRLAGARSAGDENVQLAADAAREELRRLVRERAEPDQTFEREHFAGELADRQRRSTQRKRRDDRVDAAAVGQARVDHRRRLVDPASDLRDDSVDDPQEMRVIEEGGARLGETSLPLHVDRVVAVDHDLGHALVAQQGLQRAVAEDVVRDFPFEPCAIRRAERALLARELFTDDVANLWCERLAVSRGEGAAEPGNAGAVDLGLQLGMRVARTLLEGHPVDL